MMNEMVKIFNQKYERENQRTIIDNYSLNEGIYYLINLDDESKNKKAIIDKNSGYARDDFYKKLLHYDYNSQLVSMNKPMDKTKQLHSNNYLSIFIKLENDKIREENKFVDCLEGFYDSFANLKGKYTDRNSQILYHKVLGEYDDIDGNHVEKCKNWALKNSFNIFDDLRKEIKKGYLKIFFEFENVDNKKLYEQENNRYLIPNIFNDNKYNYLDEGRVYGLSNYNMNMNQKKVYLNHFHRKNTTSDLVSIDFALMQKKLFDYLLIGANLKKNYAYFDTRNGDIYWADWLDLARDNNFEGYLLQFKKGKEVEIVDFFPILVKEDEIKPLKIKNYLNIDVANFDSDEFIDYVGNSAGISSRKKIVYFIDSVFFNRELYKNRHTPDIDVKEKGVFAQQLIKFRKPLYDWYYNDNKLSLLKILDELVMDIILYNLANEVWKKGSKEDFSKNNVLKEQKMLLLYFSMRDYLKEGEDDMDLNIETRKEFKELVYGKKEVIDNDRLFYYAIGQLYHYLLGYSQAKEVKHNQIIVLSNTSNIEKKKRLIEDIYQKYASAMVFSRHNSENNAQVNQGAYFNRVYSKVMSYVPEKFDNIANGNIVIGSLENNFRYFKKEGEK